MPLGTSASKVIYFLSDSGSLWILKWLFGFDRSGRSRKKLRSSNGDALVCQPHMPSIFTAMRCYVSFPKIQSAMKFAQSSTWQIKTWQTCKVKIGAWAKLALSSKYTNWTWETNLKSQADAPCRPAALPSSRSKHPWRHPLRHRAARRPSRIQPDHRHFHRGRPDPTGIWKKTEPDRPAVLQPNGSTNGLITDLSKKKIKKKHPPLHFKSELQLSKAIFVESLGIPRSPAPQRCPCPRRTSSANAWPGWSAAAWRPQTGHGGSQLFLRTKRLLLILLYIRIYILYLYMYILTLTYVCMYVM